ncbi:5106_t:CDS:10 [Ambispora leptoticha]|uniref:5106_t:CDS:1 n=1 Tax=Ambispora leptoticha TaxID=144679 RepID=A0A9N8ZVR9_9GLOM|nr:5106_t:CDS:10 [Ambispora leptoticha]
MAQTQSFSLSSYARQIVGKPARVRANFYPVEMLPSLNIHHYDVSITPDIFPKINRLVYDTFVRIHGAVVFGKIKPVYDGRKNLFATNKLPLQDSCVHSVTLPEENGGIQRAKRPLRTFKIQIKRTSLILMKELHDFLHGESQITPTCLTAIMALDILIRHKPSMTYATVGRSFYTSDGSQHLYGGVEVWQGYYQSARPTAGKMMINVDVSATAFYEGGPLVPIVAKVLGKRSPDDLRRGIGEHDRVKLEKFLKNLKIRVNHRGGAVAHSRIRINRLTEKSANQIVFQINNEPVDVVTYFLRAYNIRLAYPFLPCVIVGRDIFLPMEVCSVIEGQRYLRKLNEKQTADMIKSTCQPPHIRANKINAGLKILKYRENEYLKEFGMKIGLEMVQPPARILPPPTINYHPSSRNPSFQPQDGVWNLRGKKVAKGATLGSWAVIVFASDQEFPIQSVRHFVRELTITCVDTGMNVPGKNPPISYANPQANITEIMQQAWVNAGNAAKAQPQLLLCILPNNGVTLYAEIKRIGDTTIGVATQCCQSKHLFTAKKQYCANICIKINVKLGGMNSFLTPVDIGFISERPTIIIGADVSHPGPGEKKASITSVCGTMDSKASRYSAVTRMQNACAEIIADLKNMVRELLKIFYQTCGNKPERILFYRDGVSEGQFSAVLKNELKGIQGVVLIWKIINPLRKTVLMFLSHNIPPITIEACNSLDESYNPTITFVVVQKRHHTRFFPVTENDADRTGNCRTGTVVDTMITRPDEYNFCKYRFKDLQSQAGLQGTCRPCHYQVLHDENALGPDHLQSLSYNLCYLYARCTRSVSVVPPVYYAHLACLRTRFHMHGINDIFVETSSTETEGIQKNLFIAVKPELQRVMYFM